MTKYSNNRFALAQRVGRAPISKLQAPKGRWREQQQDVEAELARQNADLRRQREERLKPSYIAIEAQQHEDHGPRLIKPSDLVKTPEPIEVKLKPTFDEMRAARNDFPPISADVRERKAAARRARKRNGQSPIQRA